MKNYALILVLISLSYNQKDCKSQLHKTATRSSLALKKQNTLK